MAHCQRSYDERVKDIRVAIKGYQTVRVGACHKG